MSIEDKNSGNFINGDQVEMKYKPIISEGISSQDSILAHAFCPLNLKSSVHRYIQTGTKPGKEIKSSGYGRSQCRMALGQGPTVAKKQAAKRDLQKKRFAKEQQLSRMLVCLLISKPSHFSSSFLKSVAIFKDTLSNTVLTFDKPSIKT